MSSIVIGLLAFVAGGGGIVEGMAILGQCLTWGPVDFADDIDFLY